MAKAGQKGLHVQPQAFNKDLEATEVHTYSQEWAGSPPCTLPGKEKHRGKDCPAKGTSDWKEFPEQIMNSLHTGCNLQRLQDARQGNASV